MRTLSYTEKIDVVNIGLLFISAIAAFIIPFELFLFVYAVLGPLHYLTEISWLHDKNYYAKDKRDIILLVILSLIITFISFNWITNTDFISNIFDPNHEGVGMRNLSSHITFIGFTMAALMVFIRKPVLKIIGLICVLLAVAVSRQQWIFFAVFLPTLVHVYLFTALFMLYGALKSKSNFGLVTVLLHLAIPFTFFYLFPGKIFWNMGDMGKSVYNSSAFKGLNEFVLIHWNIFDLSAYAGESIDKVIYDSPLGIAVMRFIAFAYTYHYLNWFSKTEIIRWHKVPKERFIVVVLAWVTSVILYAIDYKLGFNWLFLLSFMHVMLEFPLNFVSFTGIFSELKNRIIKPA